MSAVQRWPLKESAPRRHSLTARSRSAIAGGGSYCFEAIEQAPDRVAAAVLQNPIGLHENRDTWDAAVKGYGETVRDALFRHLENDLGPMAFGIYTKVETFHDLLARSIPFNRFVVNQLRDHFGFEGVPVKVLYRERRRGKKKTDDANGEATTAKPSAPKKPGRAEREKVTRRGSAFRRA